MDDYTQMWWRLRQKSNSPTQPILQALTLEHVTQEDGIGITDVHADLMASAQLPH
jgi:hypothetical protein